MKNQHLEVPQSDQRFVVLAGVDFNSLPIPTASMQSLLS